MKQRSVRLALWAAVIGSAQGMVTSPAVAQEDEIADADRYFEKREYEKAAAIYVKVIDEHRDSAACGVYGKRAAIHALRKQYDDGLGFIERAPRRCRSSVEVREQEALLLWALGKRKMAAGVAEAVVREQPSAFSNQKLLGDYLAAQEPERAAGAYRAYLRFRPPELASSDATPRVMLAFSCLAVAARQPERRAQLLREARTELETVEQRFGGNPEARLNAESGLCAVYAAQRQWGPAVTVCERVSKTAKGRSSQSTWYNLALAHLSSRRPERARTSALEYIERGGSQARGFQLVGDSYFAQRRWGDALRYYDMSESKIEGTAPPELVAKIGQSYRRLGRNDRAADRLRTAHAASPANLQIAVELGEAENALGRHAEALAAVKSMNGSASSDLGLVLVSADAELGLKRTQEARALYEQVLAARDDARARRGLIRSYNLEASAMLQAGKSGEAYTSLRRALKVDAKSILVNKNLAVLAIESGECGAALEHLEALKDARSQQVSYHRLGARASLCANKPEAAARFYAKAAELARTARNNLALAEVYTEWAPLQFGSDLDGAIEQLNQAVQYSFGVPEVAAAAKRNRAHALYLRGVRALSAGDPARARTDLELAAADPKAVGADELDAARFALAIAHLESGGGRAALDVFGSLNGRPLGLKPPYSALQIPFFAAYARSLGESPAEVEQAARVLAAESKRGSPAARSLARDLAGRAYLQLASLRYRARNYAAADAALDKASRIVKEERALRALRHDRVVLAAARANDAQAQRAFASLKDSPVEALVNLGLTYDEAGDGKRAAELWRQAKAKGHRSKQLDTWLEAKQRVFGY